jgi:carotenoid cleavage dioxygenase-like enzyme
MFYFFLFIYFSISDSFQINLIKCLRDFSNKNFIKNEIEKKIEFNLPKHQMDIIKKINGFYGLIGPDIKISEIKKLYNFLTGNGIIQGIFLNNGNIIFFRKYVKTEKLIFENKFGRIPENNFYKSIFFLLNKIKLAPNIFGVANTALFNIENKLYALYDRDKPYEINLDFEKKNIETIGKKNIFGLRHFSAHSIYNSDKIVEVIDYNVINHKFIYYQLDPELKLKKSLTFNTIYFPVIHDFISTSENILFIEIYNQIFYMFFLNHHHVINNIKLRLIYNLLYVVMSLYYNT